MIVVLLELPLLVLTLLLAKQSGSAELELLVNVLVLELAQSPLLALAEHILSLLERNGMENAFFLLNKL